VFLDLVNSLFLGVTEETHLTRVLTSSNPHWVAVAAKEFLSENGVRHLSRRETAKLVHEILTHLSSLGARRTRCGNGHHTLVNVIEKNKQKPAVRARQIPNQQKQSQPQSAQKSRIHNLTANSAANLRPPDLSAVITCFPAAPSPPKWEQQKATYTR
jgi:hypothetical protein